MASNQIAAAPFPKRQVPFVGQQPSIAAGGLATMGVVPGSRECVVYAVCTVVRAAIDSDTVSLPLITDIVDPDSEMLVKIGGKIQWSRLISELIADNAKQGANNKGSVTYWQGGSKLATVADINNSTAPSALAKNTATTAIFRVPFFFQQTWRKSSSRCNSEKISCESSIRILGVTGRERRCRAAGQKDFRQFIIALKRGAEKCAICSTKLAN